MKESFKDPNLKAALTPYHPNAIRNRLPVEFKDSAVPGKRFCYPRNQHTYECAALHTPRAAARTAACHAAILPAAHPPPPPPSPTPLAFACRQLLWRLAGAGFQRFRTTMQNYYSYDTKALAVGESNQGIVSEKSKWIHQKQTM